MAPRDRGEYGDRFLARLAAVQAAPAQTTSSYAIDVGEISKRVYRHSAKAFDQRLAASKAAEAAGPRDPYFQSSGAPHPGGGERRTGMTTSKTAYSLPDYNDAWTADRQFRDYCNVPLLVPLKVGETGDYVPWWGRKTNEYLAAMPGKYFTEVPSSMKEGLRAYSLQEMKASQVPTPNRLVVEREREKRFATSRPQQPLNAQSVYDAEIGGSSMGRGLPNYPPEHVECRPWASNERWRSDPLKFYETSGPRQGRDNRRPRPLNCDSIGGYGSVL
jgi:hypothetical protein